jgi:hypothetical protein
MEDDVRWGRETGKGFFMVGFFRRVAKTYKG